MMNRLILLSLLGLGYPLAGQTQIYKCSEDNQVIYQDAPCKAAQTSTALADVPIRNSEPNKLAPAVVKQESQPPAQSTNLVLGMTDTEVLNLRGWGRPGKITRSKANRVWREEWTYSSPVEGPKLLQFDNGRLTAIHTEPVQVAQSIPQ